jgi:hypothetical protein
MLASSGERAAASCALSTFEGAAISTRVPLCPRVLRSAGAHCPERNRGTRFPNSWFVGGEAEISQLGGFAERQCAPALWSTRSTGSDRSAAAFDYAQARDVRRYIPRSG